METSLQYEQYESELREFKDRDTGVHIKQLTNYRGNSNHLYFTNNGWYDGGTKLVFSSDRDNRTNLFSLDLKDYSIRRLTDLPRLDLPGDYALLEACVDPIRDQAYFFCDRELIALDLHTRQSRTIYTIPEGFRHHITSCSADANYVFTSIYEDFSDRFEIDIQHGYEGFAAISRALPLSKLLRIRADGTGAECIHEEKRWVAHVNVSPTDESRLTFCHEGPWREVDNRIFGMDTNTGKIWKITGDNDMVIGHEYWYADSEHIGYHGYDPSNGKKLIGVADFHNNFHRQMEFDYPTGHTFSFDHKLIVGDGGSEGKYIRLWKWNGENYYEPRALCQHFSSFKTQNDHAHPRFSPDGKHVLFTSDRLGYSQLYLAHVPEFEALPKLEDLQA